MVAKDGLVGQFSAGEIEFLAENEQDDFGPLRTNQLATVPLWVARQLRRSKLCRIVAPEWLNVAKLESLLNAEMADKENFQPVPFHYVEIATVILECASEDVANSEQIRALIQKFREQRSAKIQAGLPMVDGNPMKLNNLGHLELNEIRPFLLMTLDKFHDINAAEEEGQRSRSRQQYSAPIKSDLFTFN